MLLALVAALLATACGGAPPVAIVAGVGGTLGGSNVPYCSSAGRVQTLDVYEPPAGHGARPLLLVVHGGAWVSGSASLDRQSLFTQAVVAEVLSRGFVVASINYRLAPRSRWPAQVVDVRCAVRYLRATAARWNVDPRRIAALGDSAGGQLVSLEALSAGRDPQWNTGEHSAEPAGLDAVVDCWGLTDLTAPGWSRLAGGMGLPVFGVRLGTSSAVLRDASPVAHVRRGAPPFLVIHGLDDVLVPPSQSAALVAALRHAGDRATLIDVAGAGHGLYPVRNAVMAPTFASVVQRTVAFLAAAVGGDA